MTVLSLTRPVWVDPPPPSVVPTLVVGDGSVVALRQGPVIATGALVDRTETNSRRLVSALDASGKAWWIPADAVWSDVGESAHPQHPRPIGLATARSRDGALLAGLSDRLGWEAVMEFERGGDLPVIDGALASGVEELVVLDGRLGHDVPTVVIIGQDMTRWGAGGTWALALHRALFGDDGSVGDAHELHGVLDLLERNGIGVVAVDLATPLIRRAGVCRYSVQLRAANVEGRTWDASALD